MPANALLVWVSLAGQEYDWLSWQTAALAGGGLALIVAAIAVARRVREPLVPLNLFSHRTVVLAVIASVAVGIAMFGTSASSSIASGLAAAGVKSPAGDKVPAISELPPAIAHVVEHAYGTGIAEIFIVAAPLGLVAMIAVALMHETPLGTRSGIDIAREADALPQAA